MKKRIAIAVGGIVVLVAALSLVKVTQIRAMIAHAKSFSPPPETVNTVAVEAASWPNDLTAVGSLSAVQGVTVAAELPGKVAEIAFSPGAPVAAGALLVRQDTSSEEAQLPGALAQVTLARSVLDRDDKMLADRIVSQADRDAAAAALDQAKAQADALRAAIAKKTIRAPFSGRLGIRQVNLGQMLREGDPVVALTSLDPIYVDFALPQQELGKIRAGLPVRVTSDAVPGLSVDGTLSTVSPAVDAATRNIPLQATVHNPSETLRPGMFVNVAIRLPALTNVLAIPGTAVLYAPYGDSVFVVEGRGPNGAGVLRQRFVRLGAKRGDFVAVTDGLKGRETVVSTGVFKLRNGQEVVVDNRAAPPFRTAPRPAND